MFQLFEFQLHSNDLARISTLTVEKPTDTEKLAVIEHN